MPARQSVCLSLPDGAEDTFLMISTWRSRTLSLSRLSLVHNNYLSVTLGRDLTFNFQVDCTVNKANRAVNLFAALKRASNFIPQDTRTAICTTRWCFHPHLDYCDTARATAGDAKIKRLQKIQNRDMHRPQMRLLEPVFGTCFPTWNGSV